MKAAVLVVILILVTGCAATPKRDATQPLPDCPKPEPVTCPVDAETVLDLGLANLPSADEFNNLDDQAKLRKLLDASVVHRIGQMQMRDQLKKAVACIKALRGER